MKPSANTGRPQSEKWVYAELTVIDGDRELKPAQVAFDRLLFNEPPHLVSRQVQIVLTNGGSEQRHLADLLPHEPDARRIPIQLVPHGTTPTRTRQ